MEPYTKTHHNNNGYCQTTRAPGIVANSHIEVREPTPIIFNPISPIIRGTHKTILQVKTVTPFQEPNNERMTSEPNKIKQLNDEMMTWNGNAQ